MNNVKTVFLLGLLTGMFLLIGGMVGGQSGMIIALGIAALMNFVSLWFSDKIVLKAYGARDLSEAEAPRIYAMVRELTQRASIPMPRLLVFDQEQPNAFATGRNPQKAAVALSSGIVKLMGEEELKGVKAFQYMAILHEDRVTGMRGGKRQFGFQIEIRCWDSVDARIAKPTRLPWQKLESLAGRIVKEMPQVVSVTYNIGTKPPSTIEAV